LIPLGICRKNPHRKDGKPPLFLDKMGVKERKAALNSAKKNRAPRKIQHLQGARNIGTFQVFRFMNPPGYRVEELKARIIARSLAQTQDLVKINL
jgi:hypothetical protein